LDLEAEKISQLTKISRPTINKILFKIRERLAEYSENRTKKVEKVILMALKTFGALRKFGSLNFEEFINLTSFYSLKNAHFASIFVKKISML